MLRAIRMLLALAWRAAIVALPCAAASCAVAPAQEHTTVTPAPPTIELSVFAAASLSNAYREIGQHFEAANPGVTVSFNFAGSQQLAAQLAQGAPADVFASANDTQMANAVRAGRVMTNTIRTFATNSLVVVATREAHTITQLQDLAQPGVKVVLAAPAVPAGQYALTVLDKASTTSEFGANFRTNVEANVVSYEENVRAVLTKIALGEADAGIVYASDVISNPNSPVQQFDIPAALNIVASYPLAPVSDSKHLDMAQRFVDFMGADESQQILVRYGFTQPARDSE